MLTTVKAVMEKGQIKLLEDINIPEGTEILVTPLLTEDTFWLEASESSLKDIWDNEEDNIYADLLKE